MKAFPLKNIDPSVFKYLLSGGSAAATEYFSFLLILHLTSISVAAASAASFCLGLIVSFTLNRTWSFKGDFKRSHHQQLVMYVVLALANLVISSALVAGLVHLGLIPPIAKIVVMICVAIWNFQVFRKLIFVKTL